MNKPELYDENHAATYCPEDDKLRLYVGRVPRDEYEALRREGWTSTPKQDCDFVAVWTVDRENTALSYAGEIDDEDASPQDRAADRAERFAGYRDKRLGEAEGHADRYDAGPSAHGYQSARKAERAAARHDRIGTRAATQWSKAEYWRGRTERVISHALHLCRPDVRMRRIKKIESEKRKDEKTREELANRFRVWEQVANDPNPDTATQAARLLAGRSRAGYYDFEHPRTGKKESLYRLTDPEGEDPISGHEAAALMLSALVDPDSDKWNETRLARHIDHCNLRLAYERQMIDAAGGNAGEIDIKPGDYFAGHVVAKTYRSNASGRITSVDVVLTRDAGRGDRYGWYWKGGNVCYQKAGQLARLKVDESTGDRYQPATPESLAILENWQAKDKKRKAAAPKAPPLVNPTDEEAERLQAIWNAARKRAGYTEQREVTRLTQAEYSARSKGSHSYYETANIAPGGRRPRSRYFADLEPTICKVRSAGHYGNVVILTDKPQKPLPAAVFSDPDADREREVKARISELVTIAAKLSGSFKSSEDILDEGEHELFRKAILIEYAYDSSLSQRGLTEKGHAYAREAGAYQSKPEPSPDEYTPSGKRVNWPQIALGYAEPGDYFVNPSRNILEMVGNYDRKKDATEAAEKAGATVRDYIDGSHKRGWSVFRKIRTPLDWKPTAPAPLPSCNCGYSEAAPGIGYRVANGWKCKQCGDVHTLDDPSTKAEPTPDEPKRKGGTVSIIAVTGEPEAAEQIENREARAEDSERRDERPPCPFKIGDQVKVKGPLGCDLKGVVYNVSPSATSEKYRIEVMETWQDNGGTAKAYFPDPEWTVEPWSAEEERKALAEIAPDSKPGTLTKADLFEKVEQMQLLF